MSLNSPFFAIAYFNYEKKSALFSVQSSVIAKPSTVQKFGGSCTYVWLALETLLVLLPHRKPK